MRKLIVPFLSLSLICFLGTFFPARAQKNTHINSIGMEFVLIPAGSFIMGCNRDFEECVHHEMRQRAVSVTKAFYLGKYEVTQDQWVAIMGSNPSQFKGGNHPVENVSYDDIQAFIDRLNEQESSGEYRLPTEAEWEYAARAGSRTAYYFGDDEDQLERYAWYGENAGDTTHPVGQKQPNTWGLYDMHGNVREWVKDRYEKNDDLDNSPASPMAPASAEYHVLRGGSWISYARYCRSAYLCFIRPDYRSELNGFRLAFSPEP